VDWNNDGMLDIIVGDRLGNISYFRRLPAGDIFLIAEPRVLVAGKPIFVGYNSSPSIVDWNNDNLPDLVTGRTEGIPAGLFLYMNEGTAGSPLFNSTDTVFCSGEPIQVYYSYPDFEDMNNDGLQDLVLGSSTGRIECYINSGTPDLPVFEEFRDLRADGEVINFYSYVRPSVCDWNEDGTPDLLVGDDTGSIFLYLGLPETGIEENEGEDRFGLSLVNPAAGFIRASVELYCRSEVSMKLYSTDGRLLAEQHHGVLDAGTHILHTDISEIPSGVYILICSSGGATVSRSLTVLE
jgi:hypothetical protein